MTDVFAPFTLPLRREGEASIVDANGRTVLVVDPERDIDEDRPVEAIADHVFARLAPAAPQAAGVGEDDGAWIIVFEDRDREQEVFTGFGARDAAQRRYDQVTVSWNAHLFERVRSALPLRAQSREPEGGAVDEPLKWFLKVIEGAGGEVCSTESRHNPINVFCEDRDNGDDTFNISEAAGYTQTSHDTSFDTSTTRITDKGRTYLAALRAQPQAREGAQPVISAGRALADALQQYGFPVSGGAKAALSDHGSAEALALNEACVAFLAALQAEQKGGAA